MENLGALSSWQWARHAAPSGPPSSPLQISRGEAWNILVYVGVTPTGDFLCMSIYKKQTVIWGGTDVILGIFDIDADTEQNLHPVQGGRGHPSWSPHVPLLATERKRHFKGAAHPTGLQCQPGWTAAQRAVVSRAHEKPDVDPDLRGSPPYLSEWIGFKIKENTSTKSVFWGPPCSSSILDGPVTVGLSSRLGEYIPRVIPASVPHCSHGFASFNVSSVNLLCRFIHGSHKRNDGHHLALHWRFHGSWYRLQSRSLLPGIEISYSPIFPNSYGFVPPQQ